jgi:hypothetical protein
MGWSRKRSVGVSERDEWLRSAWRVMVTEGIDARALVFVDECGTHSSLALLYGWAPIAVCDDIGPCKPGIHERLRNCSE